MTNLGLTPAPRGRATLRILGLVVLLLGSIGVMAGAVLFAKGALSDDMEGMGRLALTGIALFGGGGVLAIAGIGVLSAGFRGAGYVAGEMLPVVTDPTALFFDDQRLE